MAPPAAWFSTRPIFWSRCGTAANPAGAGGTVQTLHEALRFHVPVIWIDARQAQALAAAAYAMRIWPRRKATPRNCADPQRLREAIWRRCAGRTRLAVARPPAKSRFARAGLFRGAPAQASISALSGKCSAIWWPTEAGRCPMHDPSRISRHRSASEWPVAADGGPAPSEVADWINSRLRVPFAWADGLADFYADAHRSAFVVSYLLAAGAVLRRLLPMATCSRMPGSKARCGVAGAFAALPNY